MDEIIQRTFLGEPYFVVTWGGATQDIFTGEDERLDARAYADRLRANGGPVFYDEEEQE